MRVFCTGSTGLIGRPMVAALVARGDRVIVLTRREVAARADFRDLGDAVEIVVGDPTSSGDWQARVAGCDGVINLAGESVAARRWDARVRQTIRDSRVDATRFVVEAIAAAPAEARPRVLVSSSGQDYYPFALELDASTAFGHDDPIDEKAPPGSSFLARVCRDWEAEAYRAETLGVRVVTQRTGLVLAAGGGLARMSTPFKLFVGGRLGSGRQWTSWIHLDDAVRGYLSALDQAALIGPVNLVAPGNVTNAELARALGTRLGRPSWFPVPGFAVKAAAGEFAEYVLNGRRCVPAALEKTGFEFLYPDIESALAATDI